MATRTHVAVCLLCLVSPSITHSQDLSQNELNAAASQHLASSDFMLNKAYEQLSGALDGDRKELLEAAQQAWIEFHDLNAEVISTAYRGGSIRSLIHTQALIEITDNRAAELARMHLAEITP